MPARVGRKNKTFATKPVLGAREIDTLQFPPRMRWQGSLSESSMMRATSTDRKNRPKGDEGGIGGLGGARKP